MSGSGVIERASREISKRIQSLGFSKRKDDDINGNEKEFIGKGNVRNKVNSVFSESPNMGNTNIKEKEINIPKGVVTNGRAKFEQVNSSRISPEKPLRFFASRSRTSSPILPVKTPKVPTPLPITIRKVVVVETKDSLIEIPSLSKEVLHSSTFSKIPSNVKSFVSWNELWFEPVFLLRFFRYFKFSERRILAEVCHRWKNILYQPVFWKDVRPLLHCPSLRERKREEKENYMASLLSRGFDSLVFLHGNDSDIFDFIQNGPPNSFDYLSLRICSVSDRGLETLCDFFHSLTRLEIIGCNEISEAGLWSSLTPKLRSLTLFDCINVADECVSALTQICNSLSELNLQAYHVTDASLSYFSPKLTQSLSILRLQSCWEISNHGIVNIVHTLPNLTVLSLSGCSKLTDDGIELIAENLRKLRSLDVSWCPRVTDAALEYIACDLNHLEELTLDRCIHITDVGIGYISTMLALHSLFLRWCSQIRDFGLQHICGMRNMRILSLAGCSLLTSSGLSNLIQLRHLKELEMNNCPGASLELIEYLRQNLEQCLILD